MAVIGIDIGGTKIRGVLWDGERIVRAREFPTPKNKNNFKKRVGTLISLLGSQKAIKGIGIGAAGIVGKTTLISSPNIPYIKNFDFKSLCARRATLRLDNDARCCARAELLKGAGRGSKNTFALTIGTGIGRAYGKNRKIIKTNKFEQPEPWEKEYQAIRNKRDDKRLANFLAEKLFPLLKPFDPEVIIVGGGVLERPGLLRRIKAALKDRGLTGEIRRVAFRKNAVAVGAALLL